MDTSSALADTSGASGQLNAIISPIQRLRAKLDELSASFERLAKPVEKAVSKLEEFAGKLSGMVVHSKVGSGLGKGVGNLIQGFAKSINGLTEPIGQAVASLDVFVSALSPGTMVVFNQVIRDLNATIGVAFLPIFQVFTEVINDVAGELNDVMHELAPVMKVLAETIGAIVLPVVKIYAASLHALIPFYKMVADVLKMFVDALQPVFAILQGWEALGNLGASIMMLLEPAFKWLANALKFVTENLLKFTVMLAKTIAAMGIGQEMAAKFLKGVTDSLRHEHKSHEHAAGTVSMKGVEALNKDIAKLAFMATGGVGDKAAKSDTERLIDELEKISPAEGVTELVGYVKECRDLLMKLVPDVPTWKEMTGEGSTVRQANDWIQRQADSVGIGDEVKGFGNWVGRQLGI